MERHRQKPKPSRGSLLLGSALVPLLKIGRITRHRSNWRGFSQLRWLYRKIVPEDFLVRINDFDDDIIFDVNVRGDMGLSLWHFPKLFEKEERETFCSFITPGCAVLDAGANIGFYTMLAAKRGARVFAVEADPLNAAMLRHHVEINGFSDRVMVFEMAATDHDKPVSLYRHPFNLGESNIIERGRPSGTVAGRTLDSLNLPSIDVCKMDIEGSELMALRGMEHTLARSPQLRLLIEYNQVLGCGDALLAYLRAHFSSLRVLEATAARDEIPAFCNLLAVR